MCFFEEYEGIVGNPQSKWDMLRKHLRKILGKSSNELLRD
jgi:hypothetical protein